MHRYKRLLPYIFRQWRFLIAIFALTIISSTTAALQPWPMKLLVDYALGDTGAPAALRSTFSSLGLEATPTALVIFAAVASLFLFLLNSILGIGLGLAWSAGGQRMVYDLAADLFARLQRLSLLFHSRRHVGDSLSRLGDDTWCIYSVADGLLMAPFQNLITLLFVGGVAFMLDPLLATVAVLMAPLLAASSMFFGSRLKQRAKLGREAKSRLVSFVHQTLGAMPIVQAYGSEARNSAQFARLADNAVHLAQRGNLLGSGYGLLNGVIMTAGTAIILYVGGIRVLSGAIPLGTLLVFVAYVRQLQGSARGLFQIFVSLKTAEASIDRLLEVIECEELVQDVPGAKPLPLPTSGQGIDVRFENVTFGYEMGNPVLQGINLEARSGEVIALVGPTGAGKSTLVSLVPRFFDPWKGRVTFNNLDIHSATVASVRSQVSIVLQEPFLLPLSIADNIAYGRPGAAREEIEAAAVAACADEFIQQLDDGYDTDLGEGGASLSGGQRQRIAIARAFLKDAPVLILDESTSALDARTEHNLLQAMQRLIHDRTTLIIAHRLSTIVNADRIAVLQQGLVIEQGSHQELLRRGGLYQQLYDLQFADSPGAGSPSEVMA